MPSDQCSEPDSLFHQHSEQLNSNLSQINLQQFQTLILSAESLLRQKDAQSNHLRLQNLALQHKLCSLTLQNQHLFSIARRSEAMASALRVNLQTVITQSEMAAREREGFGDSAEIIGEEEYSCCGGGGGMEKEASRFKCRVCGEREVSVMLIPCNHLCLCGECEGIVGECPCCRRAKRGGLRVLM
ncbi:probable BOI-related E3 ubiquitin-protein ligase 3 [Phalaenopsis equestris]|uniref:probable BOI-related E3 ubiquitin-protein ligase 3 n=1 Tax=Phalaenopsis equestris TaxID=78828 RepID=UPI0009E22984|nr:probable BOI-related E3 ubiquitin-protein ligase 3 [Phalaenopsis equestris]